MTEWHALTAFQRDCLKAVADHAHYDRDQYGAALKGWLDARYEKPVTNGQLYQNLTKLADRGLVEKSSIDGRTNRYTLTDEGEDCIRQAAQSFATVTGHELAVTDGGRTVPKPGWVVFDPDDATVRAMIHDDEAITQSGDGWKLTLTAHALDDCDSGWPGDGSEPEPPADVRIQVHPGVAKSVLRDPDHADHYDYPGHNLAFEVTGELTAGGAEK